jgi:hypothetical protein
MIISLIDERTVCSLRLARQARCQALLTGPIITVFAAQIDSSPQSVEFSERKDPDKAPDKFLRRPQ